MKKVILLLAVCLLSVASFSQEVISQQPKHEVSVWGAYGLSTLNYDLSFGDRNLEFGYLGGIGYTYFLNYHWGVGLGAEFSVLNSSLDVSKFVDKYPVSAFGGNDKALWLRLNGGDYEQKYNAYYINVPLQAKYQVDAFKKHKFYAAGGVKVGIPFKAEYTATGNYTETVFNSLSDATGQTNGSSINIPNRIGGSQTVNAPKTEFDLDLSYILNLETGIKWRLSDKLSLYTGLFVDFGLNDVRKGDTDLEAISLVENGTTGYTRTHNVVLNSLYNDVDKSYDSRDNKSFTDKVSTLSAGLKVQLAFGFGSSKNRLGKAPVVEPPKPLTAGEVDDIVARNAKNVIDAQKSEFDALKDLLKDLFKKEQKEVDEGYRLQTVWGFDLDKVVILSPMTKLAEENLAVLLKHKDIRVNLVGHTDDLGTHTYNQNLGLKRAQVIKDWLVQRGVAESRLVITTQGDTQPFVANVSDDNRRYNRRVEFLIIK